MTTVSKNSEAKLPLLSAVLSASATRFGKSLDVFSTFLQHADDAIQQCRACDVSIVGSSTRQSNRQADSSTEFVSNVSLIVIYNFYGLTYRPLDDERELIYLDPKKQLELSFRGMEAFCKDFNVIPKLLTRDELIKIWRLMSLKQIQAKQTPILYLSYELFLELLARIALHTVGNESMQKKLKCQSSTYPTAEEAIHFLCHFLKLNNELEIRRKIRAFGSKFDEIKLVQPSKSASEKVLIEDLLTHTDQQFKVNLKKTIFSSLSTTSLILGKERLRPPPLFTRETATMIPRSTVPNTLPRQLADIIDEAQEELKSMLPEIKSMRIQNQELNKSTTKDSAPVIPIKTTTLVRRQSVKPNLRPNNNRHEEDDDDDSMNQYVEEIIPPLQYERYLIRLFDKFSTKLEEIVDFDYHTTEGPFIDLGYVTEGSRYKLKLVLTNDCKDVLNFDVTTSNLDSNDVEVLTLPGPIIHGLSRNIYVQFTITQGLRSVLGFITIYSISIRSDKKSVIHCPIHYRVIKEGQSVPNRNKCTIRNLQTFIRTSSRPNINVSSSSIVLGNNDNTIAAVSSSSSNNHRIPSSS